MKKLLLALLIGTHGTVLQASIEVQGERAIATFDGTFARKAKGVVFGATAGAATTGFFATLLLAVARVNQNPSEDGSLLAQLDSKKQEIGRDLALISENPYRRPALLKAKPFLDESIARTQARIKKAGAYRELTSKPWPFMRMALLIGATWSGTGALAATSAPSSYSKSDRIVIGGVAGIILGIPTIPLYATKRLPFMVNPMGGFLMGALGAWVASGF
ncbi:MAG: hypothetical protein HY401_00535 [Elusimicrobia bacterium]|nr:hypothetical protein [Elusimicrobiota bacterium]